MKKEKPTCSFGCENATGGIKSISFAPIDFDITKEPKNVFKYPIEANSKTSRITTFEIIFESPEVMAKKGTHPNQKLYEHFFGKPK